MEVNDLERQTVQEIWIDELDNFVKLYRQLLRRDVMKRKTRS